MATEIDPRTVVNLTTFDPRTVVRGDPPPPPPRGALAEIGTGLKRGALVGLPSLIGGAMQYASEPGRSLYETGRGMVASAEERGRAPEMSLQPENHGTVVNALASGGEMIAPGIAIPAAVGLGAAAAGASPFLATGAAALAGGTLFGAEQGQRTLDKGRAAGLDDATAREAARINAATTMAGQTAMGMVGGQLLGTFGRTANRIVGREGADLASRTLGDLAGTNGVLKPLLTQLPLSAAEAVGVNAAQAAGSAQIEKSYGVDNVSPGQAAADSVLPTLGMTALMGPMALVGRAMQVRAAKTRTESLAHPETSPEIRGQLADNYYERLKGVDPAAAEAFRGNARTAIDNKLPLEVDSRLFTPDFVTKPEPPAPVYEHFNPPADAPLALGRDPSAGNLVVFPDGTTGFASEIEQRIAAMPPEQQIIERAKLLGQGEQVIPQPTTGERLRNQPPADNAEVAARLEAARQADTDLTTLHDQVRTELTDAGLTPAQPMTLQEFAGSASVKGKKGQTLVRAYREYLDNPATQADLMARDAAAHDAMVQARDAQRAAEEPAANTPRNPLDPARAELPPEPAPLNTAMADAMARAVKARDEARAFAERDAQKARETEAIANIGAGERLAADAEAGRVKPDTNAPKARDAIESDWNDAMTANEMDTKAQSRVPFMKRLDGMGVLDMKTHAEQIAALEAIAGDKKASQGVRDRASMLAEHWKNDLPAESRPPVEKSGDNIVDNAPVAAPEPAPQATSSSPPVAAAPSGLAAKPPAETARALADKPNIPKAAAPDNTAASKELQGLVSDLPENTEGLTVAQQRELRMQRQQRRAELIAQRRGQDAGVTDKTPLIPKGMPVTEMADAIGDRIMELRMGFTDRLRKGEVLSDLEKERYDDLNAFAQTMARYQDGAAKPADAEFVKSIGEMVDQASKPYAKSQRLERTLAAAKTPADSSFAVDPQWAALAGMTRRADTVLGVMAEKGSEPWVRDLAKKLLPYMGETSMSADGPGVPKTTDVGGKAFEGTRVADYHITGDHIRVFDEGSSEGTILHEAVHAATIARIEAGEKVLMKGDGRPKNQQEARDFKAYMDLRAVYEDAKKLPDWKNQYGMSDVREFVAELHANPQFRDFLMTRNLWQRVVDAVRRLLGFDVKDTALLDRALGNTEALFSNERVAELYDASPSGAARATDVTLNRVLAQKDREARDVDIGRVALTALKGFLPWQPTNYIASRVNSHPELVSSGFAGGIEAFRRANTSHQVVINHLNDVGSKYIGDVQRMLGGMEEVKAKAIEREMATIGGEASRVGFDYRKNGKDNLAADPSISPNDKAYIDEIHRRYTQLKAQNPEAARLLEEGERVNRRVLIEKTATIAANLMDARAGHARHLEAELARMTPQDANFARLQDQVNLATTESLMADRFSKTLDLLDKTLGQGKNPDPVRFHDAATAELGGRMQRAFDAARALPDGAPLKEAMGALETMYSKEAKNPYFSLGRDGDFFVKVGFKGVDAATSAKLQEIAAKHGKVVGDLSRGDSHAFFRVGTAQEAKALGERLVAEGQGKVVDSAWGRLADRMQEVASVNPALRSLLSVVDDMRVDGLGPAQAEAVKQQLTRQMISMLPETAARNASIGRRGIPGYDAEFSKQFAQRAIGAVHDTAGVYTSRAYMGAAKQRADAIEALNRTGGDDAKQRAQLIDNEINARYDNMMKPLPADATSRLTSLSHSFYLGMSPAFFIRTMAQPWHRWLPYVGSKFGFAGAMGELAKAQPTGLKLVAQALSAAMKKDGVRGLINMPVELEGLGLNPGEMNLVREMHAQGKLDLGESSQLMRQAVTPGERGFQDALRYAATTSQYAEMATRFSVALASYRLALKKPSLLGAHMTPEQYAMQAVEVGMDDFSPANAARAMGRHGIAGKVTPLLTQFQSYNVQFMSQLARTVHDGLFNQDKSPEGLLRAKEARREFAGLMATTGTIAGALGMPFANAFVGAYNTLMSDKDDPKDPRIAMRQWAMTTFGKDMGTVLMKGLPSMLNLDTSTFGAQGILPGSDFLADRTMWKERSESQVRGALGPALNLGLDLAGAIDKMADGNWSKGIEAALPVGLRSFYKLGSMATGSGFYTDSKNNPTPMPVGAGDLAWRALGFQTEAKAMQGDAQRDFIINQQRLKHRRELIGDQFVKGSQGDPERIVQAASDMAAYNAKNPLAPMTAHDAVSAIRNYHTRFGLGLASGTGIATTRKQYPVLLDEESHAAMPSR